MMLSDCKKESNLSEKEKLTVSHGWRCHKINIDGVEGIVSNPWELDDCWTFNSDKTFIYSYGSFRSPTMHQDDFKGSWYLSENESLLNYSSTTQKLENITLNNMVLSSSMEGYSRTYTYIPCSK